MAFITITTNSPFRSNILSKQRKISRCPITPSILGTTASATAVSTSVAAPLADRVLIRPHDAAKKSLGGVLVASYEENNPKKRTGTVIAVGPGRFSPEGTRESIDFIQPGDHVLWKNDFGSQKIESDDGETLLALRVFCIIAKFSKE